MDPPKTTLLFSKLAYLPAEVFGFISCCIPGESIGKLLLSGDKQLISLLGRSGAVTELCLSPTATDDFRFPNLKTLFPSLKSLSIIIYETKNHHYKGAHVSLLPPSLTKLELRYMPPSQFFSGSYLDGLVDLGNFLPNIAYLEADVGGLNYTNWLRNLPKSLTDLEVKKWSPSDNLPPCLLRFRYNSVQEDSPLTLTSLPPNLEVLDAATFVDRSLGFEKIIPILPSTLTHLSSPRGSDLKRQQVSALPRGLLKLNASFQFDAPSSAISWPPGLTWLRTIYLPYSEWSSLPRSLTKLDMGEYGGRSSGDLNTDELEKLKLCFSSLPPKITSWKSSFYITLSAYNIQQLPFLSLLRTFMVSGATLEPEAIALLPRTLRKLEVDYMDYRHIKELPPALQSLEVGRIRLCPKSVRALPPNLQRITAHLCHKDHVISDGGIKVEATQGNIGELPSVDDEVGEMQDPNRSYQWDLVQLRQELGKGDCLFPRGLTHCDLNGLQHIGDELFEALPKCGFYLNFMDITKLTDLSMQFIGTDLDVLDVKCCPLLTGACFKFLPKMLRFMSMESATEIYDEHIKNLPRGLSYIQIDSAFHLTDACASFFPPRTESINIKMNRRISKSVVPLLPKTILRSQSYRSFVANGWFITNGVIKDEVIREEF